MKITTISQFVLSTALSFVLVSSAFATNEEEKTDKKAKVAVFDASLYKLANASKVKLAIDRIPDTAMRVMITDKQGRVIYQEDLRKSDQTPYRRLFDVEDMEDGTYYFELYNKNQRMTKKLEIETSNHKAVILP